MNLRSDCLERAGVIIQTYLPTRDVLIGNTDRWTSKALGLRKGIADALFALEAVGYERACQQYHAAIEAQETAIRRGESATGETK